MSEDLPLWEDDESDVKLENRLQYGHVIIHTYDLERAVQTVRSAFKLGKETSFSDKIISNFLSEEQGLLLLNDDKNWNFIFARMSSFLGIYGPHRIFLGSYKWDRISRKLKSLLALVHKGEGCFYYTVFFKGKHIIPLPIVKTNIPFI